MENGVEALKIAASILIFVVAITITISAFTTATQAMRRIFDMQNRDEYVTVKDENGVEYYLNYVKFDKGTREVGVETVIPSIYRAYKENYAIYFYRKINNETKPFELYNNEQGESINYIDLKYEKHASVEEAITKLDIMLKEDLYDKLLGNSSQPNVWTEHLGEYYLDDEQGEAEIAEVNKTKKRVIVYVLNIKNKKEN